MGKLLKLAGLSALASLALMQQAAAKICIWFICIPINLPKGPTPGGAPEMDVAQGAAAVVFLAVAALMMREGFLRARATK